MKLRAIALVALVATVAACGGSPSEAAEDGVASLSDGTATDGETTTTTAVDPEEAMLEFARCMREHGVDMPDPQVDPEGGGFVAQFDEDTDRAQLDDANEACQPLLEDAFGEVEPPSAEEMEQAQQEMLEFARCMREQGIDMPDPVIGADGRIEVEGPMIEDDDPASREMVEEATEACAADGPDGFFRSGPGDEGGVSFGIGSDEGGQP